MRLIDFFTDLYRPLRLRGKSPATTRLYGCLFRSFGRFLGRDPMLADLDELTIARYLEHRATVVRPFTVERERCGLNALSGLAFERRLLDVKPCVPQGPIPDRVPIAWSVDEMRRLLAAAADPATYHKRVGRPPIFRRSPPAGVSAGVLGRFPQLSFSHYKVVANNPRAGELLEWAARTGATVRQLFERARGIRERETPAVSYEWRAEFFSTLIPALWETGERIGALRGAMIEDYKRPHMLVRAESRKGRKRDRMYVLTAETCDRIDRLIGGRNEGPIFDWPLDPRYMWQCFGKAVKAAGLDVRHRVRFHQIRRSAASHYAAAGGDACAMLDHSSPAITARWYLDPRMSDRHPKPCDVLPPINALQHANGDDGNRSAG